jgi:hypothetical protein
MAVQRARSLSPDRQTQLRSKISEAYQHWVRKGLLLLLLLLHGSRSS